MILGGLLFAPTTTGQAFSITTNKTLYIPGELLIVSGTASLDTEVVVQVLNPDGVLVSTAQTTADNAGNYEVTAMRFPLEESELFPFGSYFVRATDAAGGATASTSVRFDRDLTIATDKGNYGPSDLLIVLGQAPSQYPVTVMVFNPNNDLAVVGQATSDNLGEYEIAVMTFPPMSN